MAASTAEPCELVAPIVENSSPNASVTSAIQRKLDERIKSVNPCTRRMGCL